MKNDNFTSYWVNIEDYEKIILENKIKINIYQSPEWIKTIILNKHLHVKFLVIEKKKKIYSITPFTKKKFLFLDFLGSPLSGTFSLYSGVLLNGTYSETELTELLEFQTKFLNKFSNYTEYIFDEQNTLKEMFDNAFIKLKFKKYINKSFLLDLRVEKETIWKKMESRTRNAIRKAKKNNVKIKFDIPDKNWINDFYSMLKKTFEKSNCLPPHSKQFYLNLINLPKDKILFVRALQDSNVLSKAIFLVDNKKLIYFSGTTNQLGYKYSSNSYLLWKVISSNNIQHIEYFDFGGAGNLSIDKFKKSFGSKLIIYNKWIKSNFLLEKMTLFAKYLSKKGILKINVV